ncbi:MAG: glycoside hydrolase family 31 protein [Armatimonadota bacterium]
MIAFESSLYRCEVDAAPFALRVFVADRLAMETAAGAGDGLARPGSFCRDGRWRAVTEVLDHQGDGDTVSLRCATDDPGFQALLTLTGAAGGIQVRWEPADGSLCDVIGDVFNARTPGHWYGHGYHEPQCWPLERAGLRKDPFLCNNVQSPIWLTSGGAGIVVPTEELLTVSLNQEEDGLFRLGMKDVAAFEYRLLVGNDIVELFDRLLEVVGKPGRVPPPAAFARPIYSTWTQYPRYLTQEKVLDFARQIVAAGLPAGVLEIDEKYQPSFGEISFDPQTFPDPETMLHEINDLGFLTTLWTSPFINSDSPAFTELREIGGLVRDACSGEPALFTWWGGDAALLDVTSPAGEAWYAEKLEAMRRLGFAGFKFDGGDGKYTPPFEYSDYAVPQRPQGYSNRYLEFIARHYPDYSESRVAWTVQREGLITREGGKDTVWGLENGLHALITQGMTQSILGYPYLICDMIPGRVQTRFPDVPLPTDELFTRWTEASAFTPIMQFSYGPWNYCDTTLAVVREYAWLHQELGAYLHAMAEIAHRDGTPIVRPLFFHDPADAATYTIDDTFLLGEDLLVAPVVTEGAWERDVYLPAGRWMDAWTGTIYDGGTTRAAHPAPCPGIPLFIRQGGDWSERLQAILSARLANIPRGQIPSGLTTTTYSATLARVI